MKNIELYIPKLEDYWYEEKLESDPLTMSYNAGYDVSYYGYHYDTGCIDFPEGRNYLAGTSKEITVIVGILGMTIAQLQENAELLKVEIEERRMLDAYMCK